MNYSERLQAKIDLSNQEHPHYPGADRNLDSWHCGFRIGLRDAKWMLGGSDRDAEVLDKIAHLLSADRWPGQSGMEDIAEIVWTVREQPTTRTGIVWPSH